MCCKKYLYTINTIYKCSKSVASVVIVPSKLISFSLLSKLKQVNIILSYTILGNARVKIYFPLNTNQWSIKTSFSNKKELINYNKLTFIVKNNSGYYYLLMTKYGLLMHNEAFLKNVGGYLVLSITR